MAKGNGETVELVDNRKKKADEEPVVECDFSNVSRRWTREWSRIDNESKQWTAVAYEPAPDDLSDDEKRALDAGRLEAHRRLEELIDLRNSLMAQVVVSVPREWLLKDAPEEIDWSNVDNLLDWVAELHTHDLTNGVMAARVRAAKN